MDILHIAQDSYRLQIDPVEKPLMQIDAISMLLIATQQNVKVHTLHPASAVRYDLLVKTALSKASDGIPESASGNSPVTFSTKTIQKDLKQLQRSTIFRIHARLD